MSKTIKERIEEHEIFRHRLWDKKERIEKELNEIDTKIIFHWVAIQNLLVKTKKYPKEEI